MGRSHILPGRAPVASYWPARSKPRVESGGLGLPLLAVEGQRASAARTHQRPGGFDPAGPSLFLLIYFLFVLPWQSFYIASNHLVSNIILNCPLLVLSNSFLWMMF
ncbi:hypothetical protein I3843_03G195900 [Carya illinoinensis]|nr:hypothetical protein I3843_03G195900 [Carya illinoinensis]